MAPFLESTTIFDLPREDLSSILQTLKPSINATAANSMSICELRTRITEWLMLNDLSTMHNFKHVKNSQQWEIPDKTDNCISCGKYRIDSTGKAASNSMSTIIEQPLTSRESLIFVGRSTNLPSSVLQIIDFANPSVKPTVILKAPESRGSSKVLDERKREHNYGKVLCVECSHWAWPNLKCFSKFQGDWKCIDFTTTVNTSATAFMCFSCKS